MTFCYWVLHQDSASSPGTAHELHAGKRHQHGNCKVQSLGTADHSATRLLNTLEEVSTLLQALTVAWIVNGPLNRLSEPNVIDLPRKFSEDALAV